MGGSSYWESAVNYKHVPYSVSTVLYGTEYVICCLVTLLNPLHPRGDIQGDINLLFGNEL